MNGMADNLPAELSVAQLRRVDKVCAAFEDAWKSGQHPTIESYCSDVAEPVRSAMLRELLLLDLDYHQRSGEAPSRADYHVRFPADHAVIDGAFSFLATSGHPRPAVTPGQVFGDYELLEELGRGGMGVVFKARQIRLNRTVALKMILGGPYAMAEQVERFHSEAKAAANLQHPNIVAIHEVGEHEGQPFLCMDYVDGASLRDVVREGPLPALRAAQYVESIAKAMHYAHQQGTLHRDLKPANVLIDRADEPRITDFGLAKQVKGCSELTGTGQVLGTPSYMPPEQALGRRGEVGPASDVYAIGAILYELITGRPPFHGETATDTLLQVLHIEPVSLRLLNPKLPRDLETICLKCLQKEPVKRYGSADALAQDLERFSRGEPIQARPVGRLERSWRWCRRKPLVASLTAAVVTALLAGTGVSSYFAVQASARARDAKGYAEQAETRTREATHRLWNAYLAQAQAGRRSGIPGQRFESLQALAAAAAIRPAKELRDEAITCMGLGDVQVQREWACGCIGDSAVQFSANLDCFASHDQQRNFWVRWVTGDREPFQLPGPYRRQEDFLFSAHKPWLAEKYVANNEAECRVWNVDRREIVMRAPATTEMGGIEFSPDGHSIVIAGPDQALHFFRVEDGAPLRSWDLDPVPTGIAFHPAGRRLAAFRRLDTVVKIMDVETGLMVRALSQPSGVWSAAWHPRGSLLATSCNDFLVYLWNVSTGQLQTVLRGHQADVIATMFNREGDLLATYSWDGTTRLWDPATGQPLLSTRGEFRRFSEDGERLSYWRYDVMGLWQLARPEYRMFREISHGYKGPWSARFSADGRLLVSASDDGVRLWDLVAGGDHEIAFLPLGQTMCALFSPADGSLLTAGAAGLQQWTIEVDAPAHTLVIGPFKTLVPPEPLPFARAGLDEKGRFAAVAIRPDRLALVDLTRSAKTRVVQDRIGVEFVTISPDGRWSATGTFRGAGGVRVWDVPRAEPVQMLLPNCSMTQVLFSPDGKWLLTSTDREYQFWDVGTWRPDQRIARDDLGLFGPMAFSPDGHVLAVACSRYAVQLIDVATRQGLARLEPPALQHLAWLCFSPDGTQLVATSENHTIQLWDLRTIRQRLATMNLDWPMPPYTPSAAPQSSQPLTVQIVLEDDGLR